MHHNAPWLDTTIVRYNAQVFLTGGSLGHLTKKISSALKTLRQERGWSLEATSLRTGVSKAMLGQIEREESSPTIATLWKISSGFNVSFSSFLEELDTDNIDVRCSRSELTQIHPLDDKIRVMPLFPYDKNLGFELFVIELLPGCEHLSPPHQEGVIEHIVVSQGEMEVLVNGCWQPLKKNDGLRFKADKPHGYRNISTKSATFQDILHYKEH